MEVLTPRSLDEALRLRAELPDTLPIAGGTDLMIDLNFDRRRPDRLLNLVEVEELKGWSRNDGTVRLGAGLTYTEAMSAELAALLPALAEASRTVGSPQIRNRGTIGGNLGTASPAPQARSTTYAAPARTAAMRCVFSSRARSRGASRDEDFVDRQRRAVRGRHLGGREPALRTARAHRPLRFEERLRAGRVRLVL